MSQAQLASLVWWSVLPAVLAFVFCFLSISPESPPPSGPIFFYVSFVASIAIVGMLHQLRVSRALLAEIDALRSRISNPEEGAGERPSAPGGPTA